MNLGEKLSEEQQRAFEKFKNGNNIFLTGPGGTGKTKLIKNMTDWAYQNGKEFQVCSMTGCSALLLGYGARTLHSWSGIKIAKGESHKIINRAIKNKTAKKEWLRIRILIVDEVSMMNKKIFDIIEEIARDIKKNPFPFGGIQVVFTGDFYQLPPVPTPNEPKTEEFCFESDKWFSVFHPENHLELKTIFRQNDPIYIKILSQVRRGELDDESIEILKKYVKREYDENENNGCFLTKLFPLRNRADFINETMFSRIEEPIQKYPISILKNCRTYIETGQLIEPSLIQKMNEMTELEKENEISKLISNSPFQYELKLKKRTVVMCVTNLNMDLGICNGSQGVVIDFDEITKAPIVKFTNGIIMKMPLTHIQTDDCPTIAIGQYPLCWAWALTIHKIQGATLKMAQIDIGNSIFEYGQTYVALSRIKSLEGLYLSAFNPFRIKSNPKVKNFYEKMENMLSNETQK